MERIDVAKLLKECPSGMKLDSTMYENIVFDKIIEDDKIFPIRVIRSEDGLRMSLTKYGQYSVMGSAKCIIFPEGKTTWEGFVSPCQFKDGDVLAFNDDIIVIFKDLYNKTTFHSYCHIEDGVFSVSEKDVPDWWNGEGFKLANKEQRDTLFAKMKEAGYKWNEKTNTLEKLTESKEDTDDGLVMSKEDRHDEIVMSGIYFDRENYADEVELHLGNYEIEVRDGKTYAIFKNQETKNSKPKFKVGDKIKHKNTVLTIINVKTNSYIVEDEPDNFGILMFSQQDKWELVNEPRFKVGDRIKCKGLDIFNPIEISAVSPRIYTFTNGSFQYIEFVDKDYELISRKFDISSLKPYDKVLVRTKHFHDKWISGFFSHKDSDGFAPFWTTADKNYQQCIPYEGNEHLLGTTDDCDEYFNLIS